MGDPANATIPYHLMPTAADARPRLALRMGITGHRELSRFEPREIDRTLAEVFDAISATIQNLQGDPRLDEVYAPGPPLLLMLSPLATGADRAAAKAAVARGWHLASPLPFLQPIYEEDFKDSLDEFRDLLSKATKDTAVVELDGDYAAGEKRNRGYRDVGRFVVRNCDLLIAVWDGNDPAGVGGTGEIVAYAREHGLPVLHINAAKPREVSLVSDESRTQPVQSEEISEIVARAVRGIIWPGLDHEALIAAQRYFTNEEVRETQNKRDFYYFGRFDAALALLVPAGRFIFRAVLALGGHPPSDEAVPVKAPEMPAPAIYLFDHFQRADCLATAYSDVHRSVFILIYALGAMSLAAGFASIAFHHTDVGPALVMLELALLAMLFMFYLSDRLIWRWREKWLDYRLLAEMLREADLLALIGRGLDHRAVADHEEDLAPRARWVPQAYRAIVRSAGIIGTRYNKEHLESVQQFGAHGRLADQIRYHDKNSKKTKRLNDILKAVSLGAFMLTLALITTKLFLGPGNAGEIGLSEILAVVAGACTALTYAVFGVRNQAELEIVGRRSERMKTRLKRHYREVVDIGGSGLTSARLGRALVHAAETMRHDVADWIGIFETKETEAG
jgi:hypothetical protein